MLSVNVGGPRDVEWEGKTVRTAIWKQPVDGPRMVRKINIDGDDQADRAAHGGEHRAVFVYQIESYRYWERELGRSDFSYGQFGENFTVDGLADDEVCIGDRYQIGEAIFEVTQPRVTCYRVGIRMGEPSMPSLLVAHHRPGFYLRVVQEGLVAAGDEIVRLSTGPEQLTVAEIDGLLYLPNRPRRGLERALRIPALSAGWKGSFQELLDQADQPRPGEPVRAAWTGFQPLTVTAIEHESATVISVHLASPVGEETEVPPRAGQYLTFRLRPNGVDGPAVIRSYSLSSVGVEDGYRISVKREPDGAGSGFLHDHVHPGDVLDVAAPRGDFALRDGDRPVALLSAGIGATPMLAMLQALAEANSGRAVWWLHGARNGQEHVFADEVDRLLGSLSHAHRIVAYSRPTADDAPGKRFDTTGRLTIETIQAAGIPANADYYLCGPEAFMRTLSAGLTARGVPPEQITTETFGPIAVTASGIVGGSARAPHQPEGPPGDGPAVTFARSGLTVAWEPGYSSLLDFAEACDVPVAFGCRTGVCHYCETEMLTGDVTYKVQPLEPPAEGRILMCCTQPRTELTLEL
ncbi:MAG TPA: MOSC and FAD-binding oxidoreductase domain-containing protein [Solirubrobacteraceae bacterium]|nr:MOSC and FAD-binding oxidoreductase domain-containing protein [Solirubrobacteraceae bacterium]